MYCVAPLRRLVSIRHFSVRSVQWSPNSSNNHAPKAKIKWYYSTDVPLTKPEWYEYKAEKEPEKFVPFSDYDQLRLERAYSAQEESVDVWEDRLYAVQIPDLVLKPVYWDGPTHEVRRGVWFNSSGIPLATKMAKKIEEVYLREKPWERSFENGSNLKDVKNAVDKFNRDMKNLKPTLFDISSDNDVADLGDGTMVIFLDDSQAAIVPRDISAFQVEIIKSLSSSLSLLMSVTAIQRGVPKGTEELLLDLVKLAKGPSLPEMLSREVSSFFTKEALSQDENQKSELDQEVIEADSEESDANSSVREIDHLVLCIHGIGQILGYRYELVNFTHSISEMRETMKRLFKNDKKYQQLAYGKSLDVDNECQTLNNRIQVLPVLWRHLISFHPRKPFKLDEDPQRLPQLSDINVDGVKPLRNIVGDVVLDVLLYYEPRYLHEIMAAVVTELNRVYRLYKEKHPDFKGKVHLFGHSLGSAIAFDLLCSQDLPKFKDIKLDFDVESLFCVGSPVGLFKLLQQKNIRPRFGDTALKDIEDPTSLDTKAVSPKCKNLYNVFHPCDPVSYRMEPLVDPELGAVKADEVPFALEGFNTKVQNLTSLGDEFSEKVFKQALSWLSSKRSGDPITDIIKSLASPNKSSEKSTDIQPLESSKMSVLCDLNRSGRVDYSLPMSVFSVALVSAISAHVSYFLDEEAIGFIMKELLCTEHAKTPSKKVAVFSAEKSGST